MWTSEFNLRFIVSGEGNGDRQVTIVTMEPTEIASADEVFTALGQLREFLAGTPASKLLELDQFGNQRPRHSPEVQAAIDETKRHIALIHEEATADYQRGVGEHDGPYEPGTADHQYWLEGWKAAQAEPDGQDPVFLKNYWDAVAEQKARGSHAG